MASPLRYWAAEGTTVNPTVATDTFLPTIACAWCHREGGVAGGEDSRTIVGLCDEHVSGFFHRVENLLTSFADLAAARKKRRGDGAETPPAQPPKVSVADLLRKHGGLTLCDACIARELDWPAPRAKAEAEGLPTPEFLRDYWRCARCGARGLVTRVRARGQHTFEKQAA
jgi:hypothetical protein